jgi:iron complex outermembrane receptor protein
MRLTVLVLAATASAAAQERSPGAAEDSNPFFLKTTVVVTATRQDAEVVKSPVAAGLVLRSELETRNIQVSDQSLDLVQGVYSSRGKGYQDTLTGVGMRGFAGRSAGQARTLVLLDGQPLNDAYTGGLDWSTLPVGEVDRIEVVRGPSSALYGGNAMAGVINILTRPVTKRGLELAGQYGSHNTTRYSLRFTDRWRERFGVSAGYHRLQSGGYISQPIFATATQSAAGVPVTGVVPSLTATGTRRFQVGDVGRNWWNQESLRARGEYSVSPRTALAMQYLLQRSNYGYDAYHSLVRAAAGNVIDQGAITFLFEGLSRRISLSPSMFLQGDGGGRSHFLNGKLYHQTGTRGRMRAGLGLFDQPLSYYSTPAATATLQGGPGTISERPNRAWFGEFQWNMDLPRGQSLVAGSELRHDRSSISELLVPNYTRRATVDRQTYFAAGKAFNQSAYVQHQWRAGERLLITSGGRYDFWQTYGGVNDAFGADLRKTFPSRNQHALSGRLAALYQAPRGWLLRAAVGNAFRSPTVYELYRTWRSSLGTLFLSNPSLEPERLVSWELGLRKRWLRVDYDATYFQNRVRDLIYRTTDFAADPTGRTRPYVNAARNNAHGVEFGGSAQLRSWLRLKTTYAYIESQIVRNPFVPATEGKRVPQVPKHMGSFGLLASRDRWSAALTGRYVGSVFGTDLNNDTTRGVYGSFDPFFEADVSASYRIHRYLSVEINVDNMLNRIYFSSYRAPGRMVFAGLRVRL